MVHALSNRSALAELFPAKFLDVASEGRPEEFLQPLMDLGYMSRDLLKPDIVELALTRRPGKAKAARGLEAAVRKALKCFRADATKEGLLKKRELASDLGEEEDLEMHPGTAEMNLLHALVSLDGEKHVRDIPQVGEEGLRVRLLQYQLDVYGMLAGEVGEPFQAENKEALKQVQGWLGLDLVEELLPLLADAEKLCAVLLASNVFPLHCSMFVFFDSDYKGFRWLGDHPRRFERKLEEDISPLKFIEFQKLLAVRRLLLGRRILEPEAVAQINQSEVNRFVVRLVQVRQWMRGFYQGRLDSDFGPMTLESLEDFAEAHDVDLDEILVKAGHGEQDEDYWCLNFVALFRCMHNCDHGVKTETVPELIEEFEANLEELGGPEKSVVFMGVGDSFMDQNRQARKDLPLGRRLYLGTKSLVRSISLGMKKLLRTFVEGVKKLVRLGQNLAKLLFRMVREALRVFGHGLEFLFSKRTITTNQGNALGAYTKFDFDMDVMNFYRSGLGKEAMALHVQSVDQVVNGLYMSLELTGVVLNIAVNVIKGPVGWVKLAMVLARKFAELLKKRLFG